MAELIWELTPVALGIVGSPLAIMALVAVLVSRRARVNGLLFLAGWTLAVILALWGASLLFDLFALEARRDPPLWVPVARLVLAAVLFTSAVWTYRRAHARVVEMAAATTPGEVSAAAPQLPGWLHAVERFSPPRCFALGLGIFLLNPVNVSCALIAALDVHLAGLSSGASFWVMVGFGAVCILPMVVPVVLVYVKGQRAQPVLDRVRHWIASHNSTLNVVLLALVGFMQVQKALAVLL